MEPLGKHVFLYTKLEGCFSPALRGRTRGLGDPVDLLLNQKRDTVRLPGLQWSIYTCYKFPSVWTEIAFGSIFCLIFQNFPP